MGDLDREFAKHYLVEYCQCNAEKIKKVADVEPLVITAAQKSEATILNKVFHQFEPFGVSGVLLIAESHFSIHTWPEDGYASFDIQTCGEMYPERAIDYLKEEFEAKDVKVQVVERGY